MAIRKSKRGYKVVHCKSNKKGKTIKEFPSKKKALKMHRAIQVNKKK